MEEEIELTKKQIERQDYVDGAIYELIQDLNPTDKFIDWDIEMIGETRKIIRYYMMNKTHCSEQEFYPYIEE